MAVIPARLFGDIVKALELKKHGAPWLRRSFTAGRPSAIARTWESSLLIADNLRWSSAMSLRWFGSRACPVSGRDLADAYVSPTHM